MPSLSVDGPLSTASSSPSSAIDELPRKSNEKPFGVYAITNGTSPDSTATEHRKSPLKQLKSNNPISLPNGLPNGDSRNGLDHSQSKAGSFDLVGNASARNLGKDGHG